ncbi:olfactory receptor 5V1-like [Pleurodeles waltl]|uniref:olfactory receptor 5V1-like n=1 Tax=Pleurodeles waltl TaxID=8319 RepID=UPI0037094EEC
MANNTIEINFILLGISGMAELQLVLYFIFLLLYMVIIFGNLLILGLIGLDARLHTAMYFFLCHLSVLDVCSPTVTVPKMLGNLLLERKTISIHGCIIQFSFFIFFASSECLLLSAMAYDRYVAICHPLRYAAIMNVSQCAQLAAVCWAGGFLNSLMHTLATGRLSFCRPRTIHHFFCDVPQVFTVSCTDPFINVLLVLVSGIIMGLGSFVVIIFSYVYISSAVLKIGTSTGRSKAFSTCSSHVTVVTFYFGAMFLTYFRPASIYAMTEGRLLSVIYTVITPLVNPLIYTLRNQEIRGALKNALRTWTTIVQQRSVL